MVKELKKNLTSVYWFTLASFALIQCFSLTVLAQCEISVGKGEIAEDWDKIFTQNGPGTGLEPKGTAGWTGGDSTYSILLPDGDTAFFFSDSYIAESPTVKGDGTVFTNSNGLRTREPNCVPPLCPQPASSHKAYNSIVIRSADGKKLITKVGPKDANGFSTSFFSPTNPNHFYWLGDSAIVQTDKRGTKKLWVFLFEWETNKPGEPFRLDYQGTAIAQIDVNTFKLESINPLLNLNKSGDLWGAAAWVEGDKFYIYGMKPTGGKKKPYVALVDPKIGLEGIKDVKNWSFWNGKDWGKEYEKAVSIVPENFTVSDEYNVKKFTLNGQTRYIMVSLDTSDIYLNWKDVYLYSSCSPQGPFYNKYHVYTTPETGTQKLPCMTASQSLDNKLVIYNPHIHPQFSKDGKLLISYNSNLPFASSRGDTIYADVYRPRFFRVDVKGLK